jgi:hypothetical protein
MQRFVTGKTFKTVASNCRLTDMQAQKKRAINLSPAFMMMLYIVNPVRRDGWL